MSKTIYIADDREEIRSLVRLFLENEGLQVRDFATGDALYEAFMQAPCDLVILDIMMPGTDGLTLCSRLRMKSRVPIILLTAKDSDLDEISGLSLGSDDYLTKPFRPSILAVRVKALLRRSSPEPRETEEREILRFGDLELTLKTRKALCGQREIELTGTEFQCLSCLLRAGGEAVSRETMLSEVWGYERAVETRVTDETIRRIRRKLKDAGSPVSIQNKWGFGYKLSLEEGP